MKSLLRGGGGVAILLKLNTQPLSMVILRNTVTVFPVGWPSCMRLTKVCIRRWDWGAAVLKHELFARKYDRNSMGVLGFSSF